jgi:NADPH-dependent 2,4-dienoyl-CoA reductase/sulfur reductase-like enzyme
MTTLRPDDHVIVVGAGLAGWRFVEALRRQGYEGALTLVGDENHAPYDRPPLSKNVLAGKWDVDKTLMATPEAIEKSDVTLHLGVSAVDLDVATTTVHLAGGSSLSGSHVVIATGTRARMLSFSATQHVHSLRSRNDVVSLDADLSKVPAGSTIAIIGGGFIGAEAATSLHTRGFVPIVLEAMERPLVNVLGPEIATWLGGLPAAAGIEIRTGQQIVDVVNVDDGVKIMFADLVIVGVGALTNDGWLATSGLTVDNGVVVDANLLATERVAAIGDVARFMWTSTVGTELVRIEHWQVANDHATHLAHFWTTGQSQSHLLVPYFWSDQYGKKIQMLGHAKPTDDVVMVSGSVDEAKWVALFSRDGIVTGVVALSHPRALMLSKHLLDDRTSLDDALQLHPWVS